MNRYCWCQYASPLCTAGRTAATCPGCRMTPVLQCCCSDDGTGYKQLYTLLQDSGQWTRCLSYLYAESRVFLQPVSPDSAAARHVVQTLSIQYNYVCEVRWGTTFAGRVLGGERRLDCVNLLTECGCWVTVMVTVHTFACVSKYVLYCQWYIFEQHNYLCNAHGASRNPPHHLFTDGGPRRGPVTMIALLGKLFG